MPHEANVPVTLNSLLSAPIAWKRWVEDPTILAFLSDLQANILKGHGRDHTKNVFLSFDKMTPAQVAGLLHHLSFVTTSALTQLRGAEAFKATRLSGGTVYSVLLTARAYEKLGLAADKSPADLAFNAGMRTRGTLPEVPFDGFDGPGINDPSHEEWERDGPWDPANDAPHAMVLIADEDASLVGNAYNSLKKVFEYYNAVELGSDIGLAQRRRQEGGDPKGEGIEHFGYVDGVSQPLFLAEDFINPDGSDKPAGAWKEAFNPSQFIVSDPGNPTTFSCGSYFVYRKLEQDVKSFKEQEDQLADALQLLGSERDRAGALVVGRFEDGTPIVKSCVPVAGAPHNDFDYSSDDAGQQCPFRAHIRKTNPRTKDDENERSRIMARRGITYGERAPNFKDQPTSGVGLIFMPYMADINGQFEFTQSAWANNTGFPLTPPNPPAKGVDAVISQQANGSEPSEITWTDRCSKPPKSTQFNFTQSVTLMGGDYFFAPSISFLQSVQSNADLVAQAGDGGGNNQG